MVLPLLVPALVGAAGSYLSARENAKAAAASGQRGISPSNFQDILNLADDRTLDERERNLNSQNRFQGQFGQNFNGLTSQVAQLPNRSLEELLVGQARNQSAGLQRSAINQARSTATRGGLAFSGAGASLAGSIAREASFQGASLIQNAALQGASLDRQFGLQRADLTDQFNFSLAQARENSLAQRASLEESYINRVDAFDAARRADVFGIASNIDETIADEQARARADEIRRQLGEASRQSGQGSGIDYSTPGSRGD